jgi:hypothetical protein
VGVFANQSARAPRRYVRISQQGCGDTGYILRADERRDTLRATGIKTKREAVEEGLRTLLRLRRQAGIRQLRGKLNWQGDLNAMRSDR